VPSIPTLDELDAANPEYKAGVLTRFALRSNLAEHGEKRRAPCAKDPGDIPLHRPARRYPGQGLERQTPCQSPLPNFLHVRQE
jgi:hypothetical protein